MALLDEDLTILSAVIALLRLMYASVAQQLESVRRRAIARDVALQYLMRFEVYSSEHLYMSDMCKFEFAFSRVTVNEFPVGKATGVMHGLLIHQDFVDQLSGSKHHSLVSVAKFMTDTKIEALRLCLDEHRGDVAFARQHRAYIRHELMQQLSGTVQLYITPEFKHWVSQLPKLVGNNSTRALDVIVVDTVKGR